jgi:hypothetical protein
MIQSKLAAEAAELKMKEMEEQAKKIAAENERKRKL